MKACFSVTVRRGGRLRLTGKCSGFFARQNEWTGHWEQSGRFGRQIIAPRSMSAELWLLAVVRGRRSSATFQRWARPEERSIGRLEFVRRVRTRATLASTIGSERLKAKQAIAPA